MSPYKFCTDDYTSSEITPHFQSETIDGVSKTYFQDVFPLSAKKNEEKGGLLKFCAMKGVQFFSLNPL